MEKTFNNFNIYYRSATEAEELKIKKNDKYPELKYSFFGNAYVNREGECVTIDAYEKNKKEILPIEALVVTERPHISGGVIKVLDNCIEKALDKFKKMSKEEVDKLYAATPETERNSTE